MRGRGRLGTRRDRAGKGKGRAMTKPKKQMTPEEAYRRMIESMQRLVATQARDFIAVAKMAPRDVGALYAGACSGVLTECFGRELALD